MTINVQLEVNEVQLVLSALAKLPLEQSADPFFKIKAQAESQIAEQKKEAAEEAIGGTD